MKNMTQRRWCAAAMTIIMAFSTLTGFANFDGFGTVYYDSKQKIFDGITYSEQVGYHTENGMEHAYIIEADLTESNIKPIVFNGEVRGTYTIGSMIKYAEEQGYKVLAGINGDIYDTSSGTPKGTVIHDGNIVTSGYAPERIIAFDYAGNASMKYATLAYAFKGTIGYMSGETWVQEEITQKIDFFNVPYGAANGLHLYNRHNAASTKTSKTGVEVVIDCLPESGIQLRVNDTIKGIVNTVNFSTSNTPIGENQLVLSTVAGSATSGILAALQPGTEIEISVSDTSGTDAFSDVKEAVGLYYSIVENGRVATTGTNINPRTVLGIKRDGSIILYVLDGRQAALSLGLNLVDLAKHMISLGCVEAYNLDGGGSSVMYARFPGLEAGATVKNSPSEASQRKVANGILLVYKDTASNTAENLHVYPALTLAMPGADVQLQTYASNALYEKASLSGKVNYDVPSSQGTVDSSGLFTAGDYEGRVEIEASSGSLRSSTEVEIIKDIYYTASVSKLFIEPSQEASIDVIVKSGTADVKSKDSLFAWSCDPNIGVIDNEGQFTASSSGAQKGNIYIEYGSKKVTIPVQVGAMSIIFADTAEHWAKDYIGSLAARGILNGMGDNLFMPDAQLTRAQFLTMLAKSIYDLDVTESQPAVFTDVTQGEWYYDYINWGYQNRIVQGMDETTFAPNASITREQMAVMICNFARYLGYEIPDSGQMSEFTDADLISPWALDSINTAVIGGIMNGQPEGDFQPQGNATRAQAAKVLYVFCNLKDGIE